MNKTHYITIRYTFLLYDQFQKGEKNKHYFEI